MSSSSSSESESLPVFSHGQFSNQNLTDFPPFEVISSYDSLDFSNNPISILKNLPILPLVEEIDLSNTNIVSFYGAKKQPSLNSIRLKNTPISNYPGIKVMCIVAFGYWLKTVDDEPITASEQQIAQKIGPRLHPLLESGWILTSLEPPRIIHFKTRNCGLLDEIAQDISNANYEMSDTPFLANNGNQNSYSQNQQNLSDECFSITSQNGAIIEEGSSPSSKKTKIILMQEPNIEYLKQSGLNNSQKRSRKKKKSEASEAENDNGNTNNNKNDDKSNKSQQNENVSDKEIKQNSPNLNKNTSQQQIQSLLDEEEEEEEEERAEPKIN